MRDWPPVSDLARLVRGRRSVRLFHSDRLPSRADLSLLIEIAAWAPSGHNRQPWRFAVLLAAETKRRLAEAMGDRLRQERLADGDSPQAVEADVSRSFARIHGAPAVLVTCLDRKALDLYPDPRRTLAERLMAVQSVAMAGQTLMLAAAAAGWATCWICAPLFAPEEVRLALDLPGEWEPQGAILLGKAAMMPPSRSRRPAAESILWIG